MLYLDYAATTPPYPEVVKTIMEVMTNHYGNPSSLHRFGMEAERLVQKAKEVIGSILQVQPSSIIFTSGGTESNNLAIKGTAYQYQNRGLHLITTELEHASVSGPFAQLEGEGFQVTYLPVDGTGQVNLEELHKAITPETILVSVMHVNNEMGRIQPIADIGRMLEKYPTILFHVDAVQGMGKLPIFPKAMGIDMLSASAHKFRGPKGTGFLYCRSGIRLKPLLAGGGQEHGIRSGTENVPLIVGMARALRMSMEGLEQKHAHKCRMRDLIRKGIASIPVLQLTGPDDPDRIGMAPHIVHFSFPGMKSEVVVHALEERRIYISSKSACSSGEAEPSRVLMAMGLDRKRAQSGLRVSFSDNLTEQDVKTFVQALKEVTAELISAIGTMKKGE